MVANLSDYKSHPHKELTVHSQGVIDKTVFLTAMFKSLDIARLSAIFHDLGKMNLNFQDKLKQNLEVLGYANHAYLSAFGFFCFIETNSEYLLEALGENCKNKIVAIITIIAKHHGNLPNFNLPINEEECKSLFRFINEKPNIPAYEFIRYFLPDIKEFALSDNVKLQKEFRENIYYKPNDNNLEMFLNTQFAFASLIQSDKIDAGDLELEESRKKVESFCDSYEQKLNDYLQTLQAVSELNKLRTQIRIEATHRLRELLQSTNQRVFALTAPTGAGKTLMLLSLANEILKEKKESLRIIYSIPFLSITEQVEKECLKIFGNEFVRRIDSKSINEELQNLQEEVDSNPEKAKEIITAKFIEDIFLDPFIITTFVRFFETLVSNINSTLLKLPSFSNCIFLIDEIQSLPPRLYTFFVAYLTEFCEKHNSYCIVSTATMPHFIIENNGAKKLFKEYTQPNELLNLSYFDHPIFNRYKIEFYKNPIEVNQLAEMILLENQSVLIIVNTIDDSKDLFYKLSENVKEEELVLLNTHFTPNDRKYKIDYVKLRLQYGKKIILVSTQLIEAGVDIDFPVLYRDMAIIPSIVQSAGRCNRNGKVTGLGRVIIFNLEKNNKSRAELLYRGDDAILLRKTKEYLKEKSYLENNLFSVQKNFFSFLGKGLVFGEHNQKKPLASINFTRDINALAFDTIGRFRLIDEDAFGEEFRCYVPINSNDRSFYILIELDEKLKKACSVPKNVKDFKKIMSAKFAVQEQLKLMSNQIIQIRLKKEDIPPVSRGVYNDLHLVGLEDYNSTTGIIVDSSNQII